MDKFYELIHHNKLDAGAIAPELMIVATFLMALIYDLTVPALPGKDRKSTGWLCVIGLLMALWLNFKQHYFFLSSGSGHVAQHVFSNMIVYDHFGTAFKTIVLIGTLISVLGALNAKELYGKNHGEFYLLLLSVCLGGMFLSCASNLLMLYLSLEALSVISYAMAGYLRRDRKSAEAGIKYVIYGAMASGIMIYGMSYLYGLTGTLDLYGDGYGGIAKGIRELEAGGTPAAGLIVVLALVFVGFLYKVAAVPFHYWSPDVYEGSPTIAAGFFSVVPKAAGFAGLIRVALAFFPPGGYEGSKSVLNAMNLENVLVWLSVATMCLGNLAALAQTNAKRMLAYSSIAHAGYMLAALTALRDFDGPAAILFYLGVYLFMNLGAFLVLVAMENIFGGTDLRHLRGAIKREPLLSVALCVFLFSLTGLPPLAGFMGKWYIMVQLGQAGRFGMVAWIGFNSVVSLYYYMLLAKAVAIDPPVEGVEPQGRSPLLYNLVALANCAALLLLFVYSEPVIQICRAAFVKMGV